MRQAREADSIGSMARVLHIEDDPNNRRLVQKLLGAVGHDVVDADGGMQGIRLAKETAPDLVLVDINIPDLDGYEVTLRLRGMPTLQDVPIVAITAEADRESTLAVGCDGFIAKPIDAGQFADTIDQFLKGHREAAEDTTDQLLRERTQKIVERLERKIVELSETNQRLEDVARLRREFLQNVSHELATPMTPVVGYLRLLLNEELGPLTDLQRKCLSSIEESTERLRSVVDTLLDVSSLETGRMHYYARAYDFRQVAEEALGIVRSKLESRHRATPTSSRGRWCTSWTTRRSSHPPAGRSLSKCGRTRTSICCSRWPTADPGSVLDTSHGSWSRSFK